MEVLLENFEILLDEVGKPGYDLEYLVSDGWLAREINLLNSACDRVVSLRSLSETMAHM